MKAISLKSRLTVLAAVAASLMTFAPDALAGFVGSDERLKRDVSELEGALATLRRLQTR